jgi:hypothetical protein
MYMMLADGFIVCPSAIYRTRTDHNPEGLSRARKESTPRMKEALLHYRRHPKALESA